MLVTRLELFLRSHGVAPSAVSRKIVHSRQHLLRLRLGESLATRRCVLTVHAACEALTQTEIAPETLFESADALLSGGTRRLSNVHMGDLARLERAVRAEQIIDAIRDSGVATETSVAYLLRAGRQRIHEHSAAAVEIFSGVLAMTSALDATAPELFAALSAEAHKQRAAALICLDRSDEALHDLATATALFQEARHCDGEAAETGALHADILFRNGCGEEAIAAAQAARGHFLSARDRRGAAHVEIEMACMRLAQGDTDGARKLFHGLRDTLWKLRDNDALARVWLKLALCEIRRGDGTSARHWLGRADAAQRNHPAVALDVLEVSLHLGEPAAVVRARARQAVDAFEASGITLTEAAARRLRRLHMTASPRAVLLDLREEVL